MCLSNSSLKAVAKGCSPGIYVKPSGILPVSANSFIFSNVSSVIFSGLVNNACLFQIF